LDGRTGGRVTIVGERRLVSCVVGSVALAVIVAAGALPSAASAAGTTSSAGVKVRAGVNAPKDSTIAVLEYLPGKITVKVGTPVTWSWKGTIEPHSVTFLAPAQVLPPPGSDVSFFGPTPPTGAYDGQSFVNSGLRDGTSKPFTMTFAKPGKFTYYCVIHPTMIGEVNVVESGKTDSRTAVTKRGDRQAKQWIKEGTAAKQELVKKGKHAKSKPNNEGTRTWSIQMGTTTEHTDILAFAPTPKKIEAGDHVKFVNNSQAPHTATFVGEQPAITNPVGPQTDDPAPGPSPQTLNRVELFNTGLVPPDAGSPPPPKAARTYEYVVPKRGKYPYYCILHTLSGMGGTLRVRS
jgi:plastocyanin